MGSFLDYHFIDDDDNVSLASQFPNNWFSILDIESFKYELTNYRLNVTFNLEREDCYWVKSENVWSNYLLNSRASEEAAQDAKIRNRTKTDIQFYMIVDSNHVAETVFKHRSNDFVVVENQSVTDSSILKFKFNDEKYLVIVNNLGGVFTLFAEDDCQENEILLELKSLLDLGYTNLCFYDFVTEAPAKEFSEFYNEQFVKYQTFKHYFFNKYEKFYKFTELNVNYDCFLIDS